jgi:hypothetical protein
MSPRLVADSAPRRVSVFLAIFAFCAFGASADMGNFNKQAGRPLQTKEPRQEAPATKKGDRDAKADQQANDEKPTASRARGK